MIDEQTLRQLIDLLRQTELAAKRLPSTFDAYEWDEENEKNVFVAPKLTPKDLDEIDELREPIAEVLDMVWDQRVAIGVPISCQHTGTKLDGDRV